VGCKDVTPSSSENDESGKQGGGETAGEEESTWEGAEAKGSARVEAVEVTGNQGQWQRHSVRVHPMPLVLHSSAWELHPPQKPSPPPPPAW